MLKKKFLINTMYLQMIENERRGRNGGGIYSEIINKKRNELRSKYNCGFATMQIIHCRKSYE